MQWLGTTRTNIWHAAPPIHGGALRKCSGAQGARMRPFRQGCTNAPDPGRPRNSSDRSLAIGIALARIIFICAIEATICASISRAASGRERPFATDPRRHRRMSLRHAMIRQSRLAGAISVAPDSLAHPRPPLCGFELRRAFNMINFYFTRPRNVSTKMDYCDATAIPPVRPRHGDLEREQRRLLVRDQFRKPQRFRLSRTLRLPGELASAPQEPSRNQDWRLALSNISRGGRGLPQHD